MEKEYYGHSEHYEDAVFTQTMLREMPAYEVCKRQGEYTIEDYLALPDDVRAELIDGVLYYMGAPTTPHQFFLGEVYSYLREYIRRKKGDCITMTAAVDVRLDCDDKTMVQPDVIVICDRDKLRLKGIHGAPDMVVEVLSPSTRRRDMTLKLSKYRNAGVKEYWMVDLPKRRILVYRFEVSDLASIYTMDSKVPVGIFQGECKVDFKDISERGAFFLELKE